MTRVVSSCEVSQVRLPEVLQLHSCSVHFLSLDQQRDVIACLMT